MGTKGLAVLIAVIVVGGAGWWLLSGNSSSIAQAPTEENTIGDTYQAPSQNTGNAAPKQTATQPQTAGTQTQAQNTTTQHSGTSADETTPAPSAPAPAATAAATVGVTIQSFAFGNGGTVTVKKGTKVVWTNSDSAPHTVTSTQGGVANGTFESGNLNTGGTYAFTFDTPGTYTYICKYHPSMKGTIIVTE